MRRDLDDDAAVIAMIETNLKQRTRLLPSEWALAYRMTVSYTHLDVYKRQTLALAFALILSISAMIVPPNAVCGNFFTLFLLYGINAGLKRLF